MSARLAGWNAESRTAIDVVYRRIYGVELRDDLGTYLNGWGLWENWVSDPAGTARNYLYYGQANVPGGAVAPPDRSGPLGGLVSWVEDGATWVGSLTWDDVTNAASQVSDAADAAWTEASQWVTDSVELMQNDPVAFAGAAYQVYNNTLVVTANTFTFGLIPTLDERAQQLMQQHNFYRVVQIGALVGREVAIFAASGGIGSVATSAGRFTAGMALRVGGRWAARLALKAGPRIGCAVVSFQRLTAPAMLGLQVYGVANAANGARTALQRGDAWGAAEQFTHAAIQVPGLINSFRQTAQLARAAAGIGPQSLRGYLQACFAAGTPILWEGGSKPVEDIRPGDRVWARDEFDPAGPLALKEVAECFVRHSLLWHVHVGGQLIRTTDEHPFWVQGKGWTRACELKVGDLLVSHDGHEVAVEDLRETGDFERVYNFRVANYHTYYVGCAEWGFSVWAHNSSCVTDLPNGAQVVNGRQVYVYQGMQFDSVDEVRAYIRIQRGRLLTPPATGGAVNSANIREIIDDLPEAQRNSILVRIARGDHKNRAFGTPRNPRMPTLDEFNPRIVEIRAGDLAASIARRRHGIFPEQAQSIRQLSNDELIQFRPEDPISATGLTNQMSLTGGHHRTAEIINRVESGELAPDTIIRVLFHD